MAARCCNCFISEHDLLLQRQQQEEQQEDDKVEKEKAEKEEEPPPKKKKLLQRCARCKLLHYCSRTCQLSHYPIHKKSCKHFSKTLTSLQDARDNKGESIVEERLLWQCGEESFVLAYRSCDTPMAGVYMLETVLSYYMEILELQSSVAIASKDGRRRRRLKVYDYALWNRIIVLLASINRNEDAMSLVYYFSNTTTTTTVANGEKEEATFKKQTREEEEEDGEKGDGEKEDKDSGEEQWMYPPYSSHQPIAPLDEDDDDGRDVIQLENLTPTIIICLLFIKMRLLVANTSNNQTETKEEKSPLQTTNDENNNKNNNALLSQAAQKDITYLVDHLSTKLNYPEILKDIRDVIPLSPQIAPFLFHDVSPVNHHNAAAADGNKDVTEWIKRRNNEVTTTTTTAPEEYWQLVQDLFFLSPGVNDLLHDYVPE